MAEYNHRGNPIYCDKVSGSWKYESDNSLVSDDPDRACGMCGRNRTPEEHDACLANLPGVMNACCGHGDDSEAYVQFVDGRRLAGFTKKRESMKDLIAALQIFEKYGGDRMYPTYCDQNILYVHVNPETISEEDIEKLAGLGFDPNVERGCFSSDRFGSF